MEASLDARRKIRIILIYIKQVWFLSIGASIFMWLIYKLFELWSKRMKYNLLYCDESVLNMQKWCLEIRVPIKSVPEHYGLEIKSL